MKKRQLVAVDLFAGGGGLTQGLKKAGFMVCAAVELDMHAAKTYAANHKGTVLFEKDIRQVSGKELLRTSPTNKIDLISACPPCQGFSQLTAKYQREDPRNQLIFEFVRIVREVRPKSIMMENVPGLVKKGSPLFNAAMDDLRALGYSLVHKVVDVANYGVPQRRKRLVVLGCKKGAIEIPPATHAENPDKNQQPWVTVRQTIGGMGKAVTMSKAVSDGGPSRFHWHVVRDMAKLNIERLRATREGDSRDAIPDEIRPDCHKGRSAGFSNVYGRMSWDQPSPTITGGCVTLSKGRFGHPVLLRTISVREAALLQSFPQNYVFATEFIDRASMIIGNALPPKFAEKMARACMDAIKDR